MKVLIAGIGNIFFGDDGFGVAVAQRLKQRALPDGVRVVDFGIRGLDLSYALTEGWDAAILIDATARGGAPGTLYVIEPNRAPPLGPPRGAHDLDPAAVLAQATTLGSLPARLRIVGCEPEHIPADDADDDALSMTLSPSVGAALIPATELVLRLAEELCHA